MGQEQVPPLSEPLQPALVRALLNPAAYPHDVSEVTLHETHISWVFLAGAFAYKLKKPVNLGFVDFSTLARREFFCHEELRLNRRLAASLYLDVVAIQGTPEAPKFEASASTVERSAPPLEYAVKMRRFPGEAELVRVLSRGELTRAHIDNLARTVARFHASIDTAPAASSWGAPAEVIRPIRENFRNLRSDESMREQRAVIDELESWSEREFVRRQDEFARRRQQGFIRECHGDMHLGNMLLEQDEVVIFDCLEFNENLRWIDVQSEIAFLVMDLEDRGKPDLAHRILNAYLESTGDYEGVPLLPFYQTYRAVVRAKVAFLRSQQTDSAGTSSAEHEQCRQEAAAYLDLALRYTKPTPPILFVTHGLSGSGKTRGTELVVEEWGAVRLRSDVERKRLAGLTPDAASRSELGGGLYSAQLTHRTYERLRQLGSRILESGKSVVIDATNLRREQRNSFRDLARELKVCQLFLEFQAPESVLRERVLQRQKTGGDASEATLAVLERQLQEIEPLDGDERMEAVTVDSTMPDVESRLRRALETRLR